jgi:hypothetical protein
VGEQGVDERQQAGARLGVVDHHRLVGEVGAGEHDRLADGGDQPVVQDGVGEEEPEQFGTGRHALGDGRDSVARDQHDGRSVARQQPLVSERQAAEGASGVEVGDEHGERPLLALLRRAQPIDGCFVAGEHGQVVAPQALHGHQAAGAQYGGCGIDRVGSRRIGLDGTGTGPGPGAGPEARRGSTGARSMTRVGPHAGQQVASAWKRRSDGSSYSAWQAAHIGNERMVVRCRSYGAPVAMVRRGPHAVQLVNGYRYRRSAGSDASAKHAAQVARSAGMAATAAVEEVLTRMAKPSDGATTGTSDTAIDATTASGGGFVPEPGPRTRRPDRPVPRPRR